MLLNHTSGVPEYNSNPSFVSGVIQHPLQNFSATDCLESIAGHDLQFAPGSKYLYTNTNYLLLSLIGDAITGNHAEYIKKNIFKPLGLDNTYYGNDHEYLKGLNLPESYWDVFNNGVAVNITGFQQSTVVSSKGDDDLGLLFSHRAYQSLYHVPPPFPVYCRRAPYPNVSAPQGFLQ